MVRAPGLLCCCPWFCVPSSAGWLQARAHNLLRQKDAELSTAKQSVAQQLQADVAAAEASTAAAQQQLEQVQQPAPSLPQHLCL